MQCQQFIEDLTEWMEGARSAESVAHLSICAHCNALVSDLKAIQAAATEIHLAESEPPARIWQAVRTQLEEEGILRPQRSWGQRLAAWLPGIPRPALAGAYAMMFAAALLFTYRAAPPQTEIASNLAVPAPLILATVPAQLETVRQHQIWSAHSHDPATAASYSQNMAIVDNFIDVCKKRVNEDPQNDLAREYLLTAYQQKADLLASMMEREIQGD